MKKYLIVSISILILIAIIAGGYMWWKSRDTKNTKYHDELFGIISKEDSVDIDNKDLPFTIDEFYVNNWSYNNDGLIDIAKKFERKNYPELIYLVNLNNKAKTTANIDRITDIPIVVNISKYPLQSENLETNSFHITSPPPINSRKDARDHERRQSKYKNNRFGVKYLINYANLSISINPDKQVDEIKNGYRITYDIGATIYLLEPSTGDSLESLGLNTKEALDKIAETIRFI